jgi:hypothetical protein
MSHLLAFFSFTILSLSFFNHPIFHYVFIILSVISFVLFIMEAKKESMNHIIEARGSEDKNERNAASFIGTYSSHYYQTRGLYETPIMITFKGNNGEQIVKFTTNQIHLNVSRRTKSVRVYYEGGYIICIKSES